MARLVGNDHEKVLFQNITITLLFFLGAKPIEVTAMNTLTSNLHIMLVSFYRPTEEKFKILIEKKAFPSDHVSLCRNTRMIFSRVYPTVVRCFVSSPFSRH